MSTENVARSQHFFTWFVPLEKSRIAHLQLMSSIYFVKSRFFDFNF